MTCRKLEKYFFLSRWISHSPFKLVLIVDIHLQLEESSSKLEKKDMRKSVFMDDKHPLHTSSHSNLIEFIPHPLEPGWHGGVTLVQRIFRSKCVVRQRVPTLSKTKVIRVILILKHCATNYDIKSIIKVHLHYRTQVIEVIIMIILLQDWQ